jgi:hypothetical protein
LDHELKEINTNADALLRNFNELTELKHNLTMTQGFFDDVSFLTKPKALLLHHESN